jgi:hypothetical protein
MLALQVFVKWQGLVSERNLSPHFAEHGKGFLAVLERDLVAPFASGSCEGSRS